MTCLYQSRRSNISSSFRIGSRSLSCKLPPFPCITRSQISVPLGLRCQQTVPTHLPYLTYVLYITIPKFSGFLNLYPERSRFLFNSHPPYCALLSRPQPACGLFVATSRLPPLPACSSLILPLQNIRVGQPDSDHFPPQPSAPPTQNQNDSVIELALVLLLCCSHFSETAY
jgi:hypothetical protein